jgi:hypothetical protein
MAAMDSDTGLAPDLSTNVSQAHPIRRRRAPWRWLIAAGATALFVVSGSGLIAFAQSGAGSGTGPIFVPADAPIYLEVRVDMPDGQDEALAQMLTAFPGFADSANFGLRVNELLDGLVSEATDGDITYSEDLAPWITGELGLAITGFPDDSMTMEGSDPDILLGIGVSDPATATAFVDALLAEEEAEVVTEEYGGYEIVGDEDMALAVTDQFVLLSNRPDLVRQSIDVLSGAEPSLATDEDFAAGFARVPAGHLASAWLDLSAFAELIRASMAMSSQPGPASDMMADALLSQLPKDMTAYLAAAPNGLTLEAFIRAADGTPLPAVGESELAGLFPAGTQLYVETRDLGTTVANGLDGLMTMMPPESLEEIEPLEGVLGVPLPQVLDFIEDAAIGGSIDEGGLWLGIAGEVTDEEVADERLERLLGLIGLMAAGDDAELDIEESEVAGTTVTTITLPAETSAMGVRVGDTLSLAIADGVLLVGTGDFVTDALTADPATSLATSEGYASAVEGLTPNIGLVFADVGAILLALDPLLSFAIDDWEDISPWLAAFDRFVATGTADEEFISARMTLYVD